SYAYTREHAREVVDLVPLRNEITASYDEGAAHTVMMHDGSALRLRKVSSDYDPTDRDGVYEYVRQKQRAGEVPTGLLYVSESGAAMHDLEGTVARPLVDLPFEELCPGASALEKLQERFR